MRLDRLVEFDERSRLYPATVGLETVTYRSYTWRCDTYNDQGQEGACVGFAWSHELAARPKVVPATADDAMNIYHRAQVLDQWPGEDYEGTSVLGGVKAVQELLNSAGLPYVREYRWAFGIEDLIKVVGHHGPVVLGINWYNDMFDTDANGFIHYGGGIAGGHSILANGVKVTRLPTVPSSTPLTDFSMIDADASYIKLHNSWGPSWGVGGNGYVSLRDMTTLLAEDGDACIPLHRTFA